MKFYIEFDKDDNLIDNGIITEKLIKTFNCNNGSNTFLSQDLKFNLHNCLGVSMTRDYDKNKIKAEFIPEFID